MKKLFLSLLALASLNAVASPAVTPRQLTNAVNYAVSVASDNATNYADSVGQKISKSIVNVQTEDDNIYFDDGGMYFTVVEYDAGGLITNRKHYVTMTATNIVADYAGAVVTKVYEGAVNPVFTNGQEMAISYDEDYFGDNAASFGDNLVVKWSSGLVETNVWSLAWLSEERYTSIPSLTYTNYTFELELFSDVVTNEYITIIGENIDHEGRQMKLVQTLWLFNAQRTSITGSIVQAQYVIEPRMFFESKWKRLLFRYPEEELDPDIPFAPSKPVGWHWNSQPWVRCEMDVQLRFSPKQSDPTNVVFAASSRLPKLPRLKADAQPPVGVTLYTDIPHGCEKVNTYEYAGLDPKEYWVNPTFIWREQDWNDLEKWVDVPQTIQLPYRDTETGEWGTKSRRIKTVDDLLSACEKNGCTLGIPTPWEGFSYGKLKKCSDFGHIWEKCTCIVCGQKRDHTWGYKAANQCYTCNNKDTTYKSDSRCKSGKRPIGDNGKRCDQKCTEKNEAYHFGWHHSGEQYGQVSCICQCETYGVGNRHKYTEGSDALQITEWTDSGDGYTHYGFVTCERSDASQIKFSQQHGDLTEDPSRTESIYVDNESHKVWGICSKRQQGCMYEGYIYETHDRDANCWCATCSHYCHVFTKEGKTCGTHSSPNTCVYCNAYESEGGLYVFEHDFTPAFSHDSEEHTCHCGEQYHEHKYENGKCVGGKGYDITEDSGCGHRKGSPSFRKCRHKTDDPDDQEEEHEEAETVFPDQPGGGRREHCDVCGGDVWDELERLIGEALARLLQHYGVTSIKDIRDCTYTGFVLLHGNISGKDTVVDLNNRNPSRLETAYKNVDTLISDALDIQGYTQDSVGSGFSFTIKFPKDIQTANTGGFVGGATETVIFGTTTYSGVIEWDEEAQDAGVRWTR